MAMWKYFVLLLLFICASRAQQQLLLGKAVTGVTSRENSYAHYSVNIANARSIHDGPLNFVLSPLSGEVDIFISKTFPASRYNYQYKSDEKLDDYVSIPANELTEDVYYVAVQGYRAEDIGEKAFFSLLAYLGDMHVSLENGIPQSISLAAGAEVYFTLILDLDDVPTNNLTISVTPVKGQPHLFVSDDVYKPDESTAKWKSTELVNYQWLSISPPLLSEYGAATATYHITVKSAEASTFVINANRRLTSGVLLEGVPSIHEVVSEYRYFTFYIAFKGKASITVTPHREIGIYADPDIFLSDVNPYPSVYNHTASSTGVGADVLTVSNYDDSVIKKYYISVYSRGRCVFDVSYTTDHGSTLLMNDEEQIGDVALPFSPYYNTTNARSRWAYFRYPVKNTEAGLTIKVAVSEEENFGLTSNDLINLQMVVSSKISYPDSSKYDKIFTSEATTYPNGIITYEEPIPKLGNYYIGVRVLNATDTSFPIGIDAGSNDIFFSISAAINYTVKGLVNDVIVPDQYVNQGFYRYYTYVLERSAAANGEFDLIVTVASKSADQDADIFASISNTRPTIDDYEWQSQEIGSDVLLITGSDIKKQFDARPLETSITFYIAAYGDTDTTYSISAYISKSTLTILNNGCCQQPRYFPAKQYVYFSYPLPQASSASVSLVVSSAAGQQITDSNDIPYVYASETTSRPNKLVHSSTNDREAPTPRSQRFSMSNVKGTVYVCVYAPKDMNITLQMTTDFNALSSDFSIYDSVHRSQYLFIPPQPHVSGQFFSIDPLQGPVGLEIRHAANSSVSVMLSHGYAYFDQSLSHILSILPKNLHTDTARSEFILNHKSVNNPRQLALGFASTVLATTGTWNAYQYRVREPMKPHRMLVTLHKGHASGMPSMASFDDATCVRFRIAGTEYVVSEPTGSVTIPANSASIDGLIDVLITNCAAVTSPMSGIAAATVLTDVESEPPVIRQEVLTTVSSLTTGPTNYDHHKFVASQYGSDSVVVQVDVCVADSQLERSGVAVHVSDKLASVSPNPTPVNATFYQTSTLRANYSQAIVVRNPNAGIQTTPSLTIDSLPLFHYYLAVDTSALTAHSQAAHPLYSVYVSTAEQDLRPTTGKLEAAMGRIPMAQINFNKAGNARGESDVEFTYEVYYFAYFQLRNPEKRVSPPNFNMDTACAIRAYGTKLTEITSKEQSLNVPFNLRELQNVYNGSVVENGNIPMRDVDLTVVMNVLAIDPRRPEARITPYSKVTIGPVVMVDESSVGVIIIIIIAVASPLSLLLYIVIGVAVNFARGHRTPRTLLPHADFWIGLFSGQFLGRGYSRQFDESDDRKSRLVDDVEM